MLASANPPHFAPPHNIHPPQAKRAAARAAASALAASHDPTAATSERRDWLVFTVPEVPVAGADCIIYFNRVQSAAGLG